MDRFTLSLYTVNNDDVMSSDDYQDRKNYQDFVYQTSVALQNLGNQLGGLKKEFAQLVASTGSAVKSNAILIEKTGETCGDYFEECYKCMEASRIEIQNTARDIAAKTAEYDRRLLEVNTKLAALDTIKDKIAELIADNVKLRSLISTEITRAIGHTNTQVDRLRWDIHDQPSEIPAFKAEFDDKLASAIVDKQGVKQEIELMKYSVFVTEKHIEDIYMKLDKLRGMQ